LPPVIKTDSILSALSNEWQSIKYLIFKLKIKDMMDARFLQLKLKELERKEVINVNVIQGRKHWKLYEKEKFVFAPAELDTLRQKGYNYWEDNDLDNAIKCFEKILEYKTEDIKALMCLGDIYNDNLNDFIKAIEYYVKLTKLDPDNADVWNNLGVAYFYNYNLDEAVNSFKAALDNSPINSTYMNNLAVAHGNMGMLDEAKEVLKEALNIDQNNKDFWYNYAKVLYKQKDFKFALQATEKCLDIDSYFSKAIEIKNKIIRKSKKYKTENKIIESTKLQIDFILGKYQIKESLNEVKNEVRSKIDVFEGLIIKFTIEHIKDFYKEHWWDHGVPGDIRNEAEKRLNAEKIHEPNREYKNYEFFTLTNLMGIICYTKNWKEIFSHVFYKKHQIITNFENIIKIRNRAYHYREQFPEEDLRSLEVYLRDIFKYIK